MTNAIVTVIALAILGLCLAAWAANNNVGPRRRKNG